MRGIRSAERELSGTVIRVDTRRVPYTFSEMARPVLADSSITDVASETPTSSKSVKGEEWSARSASTTSMIAGA